MRLLHGALGAAEQFDLLVSRHGAGGKVHRFDFHGHGDATLPAGPLTIESLTSQLVDFVELRGLRGVPCFGYSMGGYVALVAAAGYPGLLGSVTTLATKLAWTPETAAREVAQLDPDRMAAKVPTFAATLEWRHRGAGWRELCAALAGMLRDLGDHPPVDATLLASTTIPVKLMVGDRDATVSIEETVAAFRALPNGQLAVLPGIAHPLERVPVDLLLREMRTGEPS